MKPFPFTRPCSSTFSNPILHWRHQKFLPYPRIAIFQKLYLHTTDQFSIPYSRLNFYTLSQTTMFKNHKQYIDKKRATVLFHLVYHLRVSPSDDNDQRADFEMLQLDFIRYLCSRDLYNGQSLRYT